MKPVPLFNIIGGYGIKAIAHSTIKASPSKTTCRMLLKIQTNLINNSSQIDKQITYS